MYRIVYITPEQAKKLKGKKFCESSYFNPVQDVNGNWFVSEVERDDSGLEWLMSIEVSEVDYDVLFESTAFENQK